MTDTKTIPVPTVDPGPLAANDPRLGFARAVATAGVLIEQLTVDNADSVSPCPGWAAADIANHFIAILDRVAAIGQGQDPSPMPLLAEDVAPGQWYQRWQESAHEAQRVWADDSILGREVTVPWGAVPGGMAIAIYASEILVHAWDLSRALGLEPEWNEPDVAAALAGVQMGIPAEPRGGEVTFGSVVTVPEDAPTIDKLAAWLGRQP